ncbi:hypothetical protein AGMMS49949_00750 [Alphaproteobacteria bacterium]|nr:hypothetical protein AGMMS49949_00750 [Alphaproteobacteria bacterium]GHS95806.1 hypothetical protein AGMMS50296_1000 [Alphaproteobacteria bacterium]
MNDKKTLLLALACAGLCGLSGTTFGSRGEAQRRRNLNAEERTKAVKLLDFGADLATTRGSLVEQGYQKITDVGSGDPYMLGIEVPLDLDKELSALKKSLEAKKNSNTKIASRELIEEKSGPVAEGNALSVTTPENQPPQHTWIGGIGGGYDIKAEYYRDVVTEKRNRLEQHAIKNKTLSANVGGKQNPSGSDLSIGMSTVSFDPLVFGPPVEKGRINLSGEGQSDGATVIKSEYRKSTLSPGFIPIDLKRYKF